MSDQLDNTARLDSMNSVLGKIGSRVVSLRLLVPLLIVLMALLLLGFVFRHDIQEEADIVYDEFQDRQRDMAAHLQSSIEYYLRVGLPERVQQSFAELSVEQEVGVALLVDDNDDVVMSTRLALIGTSLEQAIQQLSAQDWLPAVRAIDLSNMTIVQRVDREHNAILAVAPVSMDKSDAAAGRVGRLFIYTDISVPLTKRYVHTRSQMLHLLAGFLGLAVLISLVLHWAVTRRVVKLLGGAQQVGAGKLDTRSGIGGRDEIGRLGAEFDNMVRKMARASLQVRKLSRAVEQSPNSVIITDTEGAIEYVNPHFCRVTGYSAEEVVGKTMRMHQSGLTSTAVYEDLWNTIKAGKVWRGELQNKSKHGRLYWEELCISPVFDEQGNITNFLSEQIDITARRQSEEQIRLFERVFVNANEGIMITDANNRILAVNPAFANITGYRPEEVVGKNPSVLSSSLMDAGFYQRMWSALADGDKWQGEIFDRRKNGELYAEWLSINALRDNSGHLTHYVALMTDISERKEAEKHMAYLAQHDVLTGLPNRVLFQDRLQQAVNHAERQQESVALLFMDLDRFKDVNDTLGHHVGDLLLQEVARRILQCVRSSDTVSRQGGDEFVIMLPNLSDLGNIVMVVEKLIESIAAPYELQGHVVHVTASVGVSVFPEDGADIETLLRNADTAMYQAKESGRNDYRFYTQEMNRAVAKRVGLENKLRQALKNGELRLHYQPKVDLGSGEIVAAEALLRWQHPVDGLISPAEFIPVAEETGMIVQIGSWVLNEACRQNQQWREQGLREIVIAVNLSPVQFHERNLDEMIQAALLHSGLPAVALELEITESAMMRDPDQAIVMLNKISAAGIKISVDDFGTGYSSLSYLKKLPLDELKIDQSFVRDLSVDRDDAAIVRAVVSMAKSLGLKVIAEGVENAEQLQFLKQLDCDRMQGYYFSVPLPADEFAGLLAGGRRLEQ